MTMSASISPWACCAHSPAAAWPRRCDGESLPFADATDRRVAERPADQALSEFGQQRVVVHVRHSVRVLFSADSKKDPKAGFIPRISVREPLARDLNDLVVERAMLELMVNARHIKEIQLTD
jgi:hypothetical protein